MVSAIRYLILIFISLFLVSCNDSGPVNNVEKDITPQKQNNPQIKSINETLVYEYTLGQNGENDLWVQKVGDFEERSLPDQSVIPGVSYVLNP